MGYNGYSNYVTWAWCLWIDNEEGSQRHALALARHYCDKYETEEDARAECPAWSIEDARRFGLADHMKDEAQDEQPELAGPWSDLLQYAVGEIDWNEVAGHYLADLAEIG